MASAASPKRRRLDGDTAVAAGGSSRSSSTSTNESFNESLSSTTRRMTPSSILDAKVANAMRKTPTARSLPPPIRLTSATRATNGLGIRPLELKRLEGETFPATRKRKPVELHTSNGTSASSSRDRSQSSKSPLKQMQLGSRSPPLREKLGLKQERKINLERQLKLMEREIEMLKREVGREKQRFEKEETQAQNLKKEGDLEALIARLLSSNDSSIKTLPKRAKFDFEDALADPKIPSLLPQPTEKPLKELNSFHNLTFISNELSMLPTEEGGNPMQQHKIDGFSGERFLYFQVQLVVDTTELTAQSLSCQVTPWARNELSGFIARCIDKCDISQLLYGLSSYTDLCTLRARVFSQLCTKHPNLLPDHCVKPRVLGSIPASAKLTRREIVSQLGTSLLLFRDRAAAKSQLEKLAPIKKKGKRGSSLNSSSTECGIPEFVLRWKITLNSEGDAESRVDGEARVPSAWVRTDGNDQNLRQIPVVFRNLMDQHGVSYAANCMVSLLFPATK